ncbi:glycogen synthase GlgA [Defluviitalea saccharophila]|uniref:Glycogen synthase n=1 Tax=Defluviitalea saccharophila TaxID=879970 RepID=A0ABZ2Y6K4_9FIRM
MQNSNLKILFVVSEMAPFAKTGGVGEFAGTLPFEIASLGWDVRIVMPKYKHISDQYTHCMEYVCDYPVNLDWRKQTAIIRKIDYDNGRGRIPCYFIDNAYYFDRQQMYSNPDDAERFAFFCKAVLEMLPKINFMPDIIHCNDWETGPICVLLHHQYKYIDFYKNIKTVFTIHNLQCQGNFPKDTLSLLSLGEEFYHPDSLEFYGSVNYMKAGIVYSDLITTVSPTYAKEIQMPEYGNGLDGVIRKRQSDLFGIINGINYNIYNPETDPYIYQTYNYHSLENKQVNKSKFQNEIGLEQNSKIPLIAMISYLSDEKGFDLIEESIEEIMQMNIQFIILGTGDPFYEDLIYSIQQKYPNKMRAIIAFNMELAQKIFAASDIYLIPSKFEACGLNQMIALRYGSVPIARATGGLADTIIPFDMQSFDGSGFIFKEHCKQSMLFTLKTAIELYNTYPSAWKQIVLKGMKQDVSWNASALQYTKLYQKLTER